MSRQNLIKHHKERSSRAKASAELDIARHDNSSDSKIKTKKPIDRTRDNDLENVNGESEIFHPDQIGQDTAALVNRPRCVACGDVIEILYRESDTS